MNGAQHFSRSLISNLLVTGFCGLSFGGGLVILLSGVFAGVTSLGTSSRTIPLLLGLILTLGGPITLGIYLAPGRRGLFSGVIGIAGAIATWYIFGHLQMDVEGWIYYSIIVSVIAICIEVGTKFINTPKGVLGRLAGTIAGLLLSLITNNILLDFGHGNSDNRFLILTVQLPILVWLSIVFFPHLLNGRSSWKGLWAYSLIILFILGSTILIASNSTLLNY